MIHFVVGRTGSFSIRYYLEEEGRDLADRMRVVTYDELFDMRSLPLGTYVFTGTDELAQPERAFVSALWDRLRVASPSIRLINHPNRTLSRYQLLRSMYDRGLNEHRAFRASRIAFGSSSTTSRDDERSRPLHNESVSSPSDDPIVAADMIRYPVFVRFANRHEGSLTPLLASPDELARGLASLLATRVRLDELLVIEFSDTGDAHGVFRKYSAYRVGDRVMPRCLECSREWMVKWEYRILDDERSREESCYLETNPHEAWIRDVFESAHIEYGRIDYGVLDGTPQVWEINTNPTIGRGPGPRRHNPPLIAYKQSLSPGYDSFYDNFREAWLSLDSDTDAREFVELVPAPDVMRGIERVRRQRARARSRAAVLDAILRQQWLRPIKGVLKQIVVALALTRLRGRRPKPRS